MAARENMDYRHILLAILMITVVECLEGTQENVPTSTDTTNVVQGTIAPKVPRMCSVCNCTGNNVDCVDKGLIGHFEASEWPKTAMDVVVFQKNTFIHLKPFPNLTISRLILRENQITRIEECAFKQLINLTELDLSHNQLTSEFLTPHVFEGRFSPESYEPLSKVTILNLASNTLHSLHQDLFEHLTSLKVLNLANNPFETIDMRTHLALSSLVYLEELDISYCELKNLPDHLFHTLRHLRNLTLTGNRFTVVPYLAFEELESLEYLYLDENPIQIISHLNVFPNIPNLKVLSLCCMPHLTTVGSGAFSGLTALESLRIENCPKLESIDENALVKQKSESTVWPQLKELYLSDNSLRYLPTLLIARWDRLEKLDLTNNKWACDCYNQYLIGTVLRKYGKKLMGDDLEKLKCYSPPEHEGKNLTSLFDRKLRCPDLYGAQPEKDAAILVGVLIGLLLAIPICMILFLLWRRGFFFCGSQGPASFSRAFYKRAANDDEL